MSVQTAVVIQAIRDMGLDNFKPAENLNKDQLAEFKKIKEWIAGKDKNGNPTDKDINNPNAALRNRLLIGLVIMKNTNANDSGEWSGGTIYDPDNGNEYSCKIWLDDAHTLNIRGFIGISLLGRTEKWTRIAK
jgi:uncharacterized protein (DUF2147 family)